MERKGYGRGKKVFFENAINGDKHMNSTQRLAKHFRRPVMSMAAILAIGYSAAAFSQEAKVLLAGNQENPQVTTTASASGAFKAGADGSVSGSLTTLNLVGTAAHIHEGAVDKNGAVVIPLTQSSPNVWSVPAGAKFTDAQLASYKAGQMYVNVHSAANKGGEIRGQLVPK
jgi:hypothetical protein